MTHYSPDVRQRLSPVSYRSPNFDERLADGEKVKPTMVIIHYTGMRCTEDVIAHFRNPEKKASAHYLIDEHGMIMPMVNEDKCAWHAGRSHWRGQDELNRHAIGIELSYRWHGLPDFREAQIESAVALLHDITRRHGIAPTHVIGHSDVAPRRKEDPGEKFPWQMLAEQGLGLWPRDRDCIDIAPHEALGALEEIGYETVDPHKTVEAFQRRFAVAELGQGLTPATCRRIAGAQAAAIKAELAPVFVPGYRQRWEATGLHR